MDAAHAGGGGSVSCGRHTLRHTLLTCTHPHAPQGGVCTTASEVALSFRTPQRLANALPTVVVLKDVHLWYPVEVARSGAQNSIEHSRLCGGDERRVVRASLFTVDSTGIAPIVSRQLRKTFKGVEAACVQRSLETIAGGDACGVQR